MNGVLVKAAAERLHRSGTNAVVYGVWSAIVTPGYSPLQNQREGY